MATQTQARESQSKVETGIVVSDKRRKTIAVEVRRLVRHPRYGKYLYRSTICHAHDEQNEAHVGDQVEIAMTRPLSKQKRWRLVRVLARVSAAAAVEVKDVVIPAKTPAPAAPAAPEAGAEPSPAQA